MTQRAHGATEDFARAEGVHWRALWAPLLLACCSVAYALVANARPPRAAAARVPAAQPLTPPAVLALLADLALGPGAWSVDPDASRGGWADERGERRAASKLRGSFVLEGQGRVRELLVEAELDGDAHGRALRLSCADAASVSSAIPTARTAAAPAVLALDGARRDVTAHLAWMPIGPGRLRLSAEVVLGAAPDSLSPQGSFGSAGSGWPWRADARSTLVFDLALAVTTVSAAPDAAR